MLMILIFASCKDENAFMPGDDGLTCYSILVSAPNNATRAYYEESADGSSISVKWEKGDVIVLKSENKEYSFVYKKDTLDGAGKFVHYGEIPNATRLYGTVSFGSDPGAYKQVQKKNNKCKEWLIKNISAFDLTKYEVISLLPSNARSLIHIQLLSPALFPGKSVLEIKGLKNNYTITLGENPDYVFADKGEMLDIYVTIPADQKSIEKGATLKFYFYAYDNLAGSDMTEEKRQKNGDEYHYYMKCNETIALNNSEVVKLPLPNKPTHVALQMGLKVKWATTNVGATSDQPGEASFGRYFPWGMVEEHYEYAWNGVRCPLEGKNESALKEVFGSSFTSAKGFQGMSEIIYQGEKFGDAATYNWGDDWVTPSKSDVDELINNCTIQKSFSYNLEWAKEGIVIPHAKTHGLYVISKNEKYKNKKIWFPAAGGVHNKYMGTIDSPASNDGSNGVYMTTTMATSNDKNFAGFVRMSFNSAPGTGLSTGCWIDGNPVWEFYRKHGSTVRPIRKK